MERIELIINRDGSRVTVKPTGFSGPACEAATRGIEADLGTAIESSKTPEYHQKQTGGQRQQASGR